MSQSNVFFVIGMHRSGTSVVTKLLQLMGAYVGTSGDLLPPSPDNPKGFFERKDVLAVNQAIFRHRRSNWYTVKNYDAEYAPLPQNIKDGMQRVIDHMSQHEYWALKDPRMCFTLPYWLELVPDPTIITVCRHPSEIAQSLLLRNDIQFEDGLALWQAYIEHALENIEGRNTIHTQYADIVDAANEKAMELYEQLKPLAPNLREPSAQEVTAFVSPSLRRKAHRTDLSPEQQALFNRWQS